VTCAMLIYVFPLLAQPRILRILLDLYGIIGVGVTCPIFVIPRDSFHNDHPQSRPRLAIESPGTREKGGE
jgi:hypothetical protein